jgi:hypothetical protein
MKLQLISALVLSFALNPAVLAYSAPNDEMRMERRAPLSGWFPSPSQQDHPPMYPSGGWTPPSTSPVRSPVRSPALSRQSSGGSSSGSDRFLQNQAGWQNFAQLQLSDPESPRGSSGPSSPVRSGRSASPSPPRRQEWERQTPSPSTGGATPYFGGMTPQSSPESSAGTSRQSGKKKGALAKVGRLFGRKKH